MLSLNGTKISGSAMKISASLPLSGQDLSGNSSFTTQAETGDKPQVLSVRLDITFDKASDLTNLTTLAKAKNDTGERQAYTVVNNTAEAMSIRQVKFQGDLTASEDESLQLWHVAFKLIEFKSVAELVESRQQAQAVTDQTPAGETVQPVDSTIPVIADLSSFEQVLSFLETGLTPDDDASTAS